MNDRSETIIIGGGQAGLATSYHLKQRGREHIILEQAAQAGNAWRNDRWDSFNLLTPNWAFRLPGAEYQGDQPHGYMPRDEIVSRFEQYVERYHFPIRYQARVTSIKKEVNGKGYRVETGDTLLRAKNVVIATGFYQQPKIPSFSAHLSTNITQIEQAATNSFDGSDPHIWYVIFTVHAQNRIPCDPENPGPPLHRGTSESGGSFYLHTKDGWVWMPEGRFPEFIGHWMKKLDLAGPGDPTHIPRGPASLNFRFFLPGL